MTALMIDTPLADQIRAIAEHEHRPIEVVLGDMVEKYIAPLTDEEINVRLRAIGGITLPLDESVTPPISEEELEEIAHRVGAVGSLSALIIEERKQGW